MRNGTFKNRSIFAKTLLVVAYAYIIFGAFLGILTILGLITAFLTFVFTGTAFLIVNSGERFVALFVGTLIWDAPAGFLLAWLSERR